MRRLFTAIAALVYFASPAIAQDDVILSRLEKAALKARLEYLDKHVVSDAEALGPDRVVIMHAGWCQSCPAVLQDALEGLAVMVRSHHGWTFGNTDDRMIQFVDADEDTDLTAALNEHLGGDVGLPFVGKIEGGEVVRQWQNGCTEPLDQWTLGWLSKGVSERPDPPPKLKATVPTSGNYPLRGRFWTVEGSRNPSKSFLVSHLIGNNNHRGKFDRGWLNSLTWHELMSLHSDDHERRLQTQYINKTRQVSLPATAPVKAAPRTITSPVRVYSSCPTGKCPTYRIQHRGPFRRMFQ